MIVTDSPALPSKVHASAFFASRPMFSLEAVRAPVTTSPRASARPSVESSINTAGFMEPHAYPAVGPGVSDTRNTYVPVALGMLELAATRNVPLSR